MKTKLWVGLAIAGGIVALGAATTLAHHAFAAEFDANRPVNLQGKVTRVEWINPHAWIHIDALERRRLEGRLDGGRRHAQHVAAPWHQQGFSKLGTEIVVRGYQSKDALCTPKCRANGRDVTFPDGRKLFMGSSGTGAPKDGSDDAER